jgi:hypothetical protein
MALLINLVIVLAVGGLVFWLIMSYLAPLLPEPVRTIVQIGVVLLAVIYLLMLLTGWAALPFPVGAVARR